MELRSRLRRLRRRIWVTSGRFVREMAPVQTIFWGYLLCCLAGWLLLSLPIAHDVSGVSALDHLFVATSAISTTGLATISVHEVYSTFGELVILGLIQMGGIGYMTIGSFIILTRGQSLNRVRSQLLSSEFAVPQTFRLDEFIRSVVVFTFTIELIGFTALWIFFSQAGVPDAGYQALFHAISAFCTAGFSLFDAGLVPFANNVGVNIVISALAYLGAIGFIVALDEWRVRVGRQKQLTFTSRIILRMTFWLTVGGTLGIFLTTPRLPNISQSMHLMQSFFQSMTSMTTVGFNTIPIGELAQATMFIVIVLMVIGASPSGTGGGLKTTTLTAVYAIMRSVLQHRQEVRFWGRRVPLERLNVATASLVFYILMLTTGMFVLTLTESHPFQQLVFEAASAIGTVGLSMGITGNLTALGKLTVIVLMFAGRLGPLSFGSALFLSEDDPVEIDEEIEVIV